MLKCLLNCDLDLWTSWKNAMMLRFAICQEEWWGNCKKSGDKVHGKGGDGM